MNFTGNIKKEVEKKCEFEDALNLTGKYSTRFFFNILERWILFYNIH